MQPVVGLLMAVSASMLLAGCAGTAAEPDVVAGSVADCPDGPVQATNVTCTAQREKRMGTSPARHAQISSREDIEAVLKANPTAVMGWEVWSVEIGVIWIEAGLTCPRHEPSKVIVVEFPIWPKVDTARAVYDLISAHNRALLRDAYIDSRLGCAVAPDPAPG